MGCFEAKAVREPRSAEIDEELSAQRKALHKERVATVLLLGCGETGKSTFLKQLKIIHNIALLPAFQHQHMEQHIRASILLGCQLLIPHLPKTKVAEVDEFRTACEFISTTNGESDFSDNLEQWRTELHIFSNSPLTQETYSKKIDLKIPISIDLEYFFKRIDIIFSASYSLDQEDMIHTRVVTIGVHEFEFTPPDSRIKLKFIDVGGQSSERRKWVKCFDNIDCVLFFSALDSYCLAASSPNFVYRIEEELTVWEQIQTQIKPEVLFLVLQNKTDIFQKVIETHPLNKYFQDFPARRADNYEYSLNYLQEKFKMRYKREGNLRFHQSNALDRTIVEKIWIAVRRDITEKAFSRSGLLDM